MNYALIHVPEAFKHRWIACLDGRIIPTRLRVPGTRIQFGNLNFAEATRHFEYRDDGLKMQVFRAGSYL